MAEPSRFVHIVDEVPELDRRSEGPVLIHALDGFLDAGNAASLAAMELLLGQEAEIEDPLLRRIEQELMPAFAGLLRRSERRTQHEGAG